MTEVELFHATERDLSTITYGDITGGAEPTFREDPTGESYGHLVFEVDLTQDQIERVRFRAQGSAQEDVIRTGMTNALADLRTIRDTTGSLTNAQLSNAVRVLARVAIWTGRLLLRQTRSSD